MSRTGWRCRHLGTVVGTREIICHLSPESPLGQEPVGENKTHEGPRTGGLRVVFSSRIYFFFPHGKVLMKEVASSRQEKDVRPHTTGQAVRAGTCRVVGMGGSPCLGWAELLAGSPCAHRLLERPLPLSPGLGLCACSGGSQPMGAMSAARSQPSSSPWQARTRSQLRRGGGCCAWVWRTENPPQALAFINGLVFPVDEGCPCSRSPPSPIILVRGLCGSGPHKGHPRRLTGSDENWRGEEMGRGSGGCCPSDAIPQAQGDSGTGVRPFPCAGDSPRCPGRAG